MTKEHKWLRKYKLKVNWLRISWDGCTVNKLRNQTASMIARQLRMWVGTNCEIVVPLGSGSPKAPRLQNLIISDATCAVLGRGQHFNFFFQKIKKKLMVQEHRL